VAYGMVDSADSCVSGWVQFVIGWLTHWCLYPVNENYATMQLALGAEETGAGHKSEGLPVLEKVRRKKAGKMPVRAVVSWCGGLSCRACPRPSRCPRKVAESAVTAGGCWPNSQRSCSNARDAVLLPRST